MAQALGSGVRTPQSSVGSLGSPSGSRRSTMNIDPPSALAMKRHSRRPSAKLGSTYLESSHNPNKYSFARHLTHKFALVNNQVEVGLYVLKRLAMYLRKISSLQEQYAKGVLDATKHEREKGKRQGDNMTRHNKAYMRMEDLEIEIATRFDSHRLEVNRLLATPLESFFAETEAKRKSLSDEYNRRSKEIDAQRKQIRADRQHCKKLWTELQAALQEVRVETEKDKTRDKNQGGLRGAVASLQEPPLVKAKKAMRKAQEKVYAAFTKFEASSADAVEQLKAYYAEELPSLLSDMQRLESDRLECLKKHLSIYNKLHATLVSPIPLTQTLAQVVSVLSKEAELESCVDNWVSMHGEPPAPTPLTTGLPCVAKQLKHDSDAWIAAADNLDWENDLPQLTSVDSIVRPRATSDEDRALRELQRKQKEESRQQAADSAQLDAIAEASVSRGPAETESTIPPDQDPPSPTPDEEILPTLGWARAKHDLQLDGIYQFQTGDIIRVTGKGFEPTQRMTVSVPEEDRNISISITVEEHKGDEQPLEDNDAADADSSEQEQTAADAAAEPSRPDASVGVRWWVGEVLRGADPSKDSIDTDGITVSSSVVFPPTSVEEITDEDHETTLEAIFFQLCQPDLSNEHVQTTDPDLYVAIGDFEFIPSKDDDDEDAAGEDERQDVKQEEVTEAEDDPEENSLLINAGDFVRVISREDPHWWFGEFTSADESKSGHKRQTGFFPRDMVMLKAAYENKARGNSISVKGGAGAVAGSGAGADEWSDDILPGPGGRRRNMQNIDLPSSPVLNSLPVPQVTSAGKKLSASESRSDVQQKSLGNAIRARVSQKKRRYIKNGYDLDLSYISKDIIAMGFPSEGIESRYRNPMEDVQRFFAERHDGHFKIYNLCSERHYDPFKFGGNVSRFPFDDHNPCPFDMVHPFCASVNAYLEANPKNVTAIHCKAGKGRTGFLISCFLLYSRRAPSATEALNLFALKRTYDGKGVTIPSQIRYVRYYERFLRDQAGPKLLPAVQPMKLMSAMVTTIPEACKSDKVDVWFTVKLPAKSGDVIYSSKDKITCVRMPGDATNPLPYLLFKPRATLNMPVLDADVRIEVFYGTTFGKQKILQCWFNTRFLQSEDADSSRITFSLPKNQLDKACKDKKHRDCSAQLSLSLFLEKQ